jgi:hypothetical protein
MRFIWPPRTGCTSSRQSFDPKRVKGLHQRRVKAIVSRDKRYDSIGSDPARERSLERGRSYCVKVKAAQSPTPEIFSPRALIADLIKSTRSKGDGGLQRSLRRRQRPHKHPQADTESRAHRPYHEPARDLNYAATVSLA